jgi:hypothetical protein
MSKKRKSMDKEYVNHPRYGDKPIHSGNSFSKDEIEQGFWGYSREHFFPESVIIADIEKQNYSTFPRTLYVDIKKQCIQCKRSFIFFALEQKYWYEILGFYIDTDCVKCIDCRKKEREIKKMAVAYETLLKKEEKNDFEISELKKIALELYQLGYIRNKHKVDKIG